MTREPQVKPDIGCTVCAAWRAEGPQVAVMCAVGLTLLAVTLLLGVLPGPRLISRQRWWPTP